LALLGDPVNQTCGIQQRCYLIEQLLDVESDFNTLLIKACTGAGIGRAPYSRNLIKPVRISVRNVLIVASTKCPSIGVNSFADATHASYAPEVERNQSNHVAHFARCGFTNQRRAGKYSIQAPINAVLSAEW
jgi:hypothetical protein